MRSEYLRKTIHMLVLLPALLMRWLDPVWALLFGWIAIFINFFLMERFAGGIFRDLGKKRDWGLVLYTLGIFILVLWLYDEIYIAVGAFAIQALGDGAATMAGLTFKSPRLPWNPKKSEAGAVGFFLASLLSVFLMKFVDPSISMAAWIGPVVVAGALCALLESAPLAVNDNLTVPLAAGAILKLFAVGEWGALIAVGGWAPLGWAVLASAAAMAAAHGLGWLTTSGAILGLGIGVVANTAGGPALFLLLAVFLALASADTIYRYDEKMRMGRAQLAGGRRSARHVIANGAVVAYFALWHGRTGDPVALVAAIAAVAAAFGDTLSTELGMVWGRRPFHIITLEARRPGESGVISMAGALAGAAGLP
ncbi:DUF92 domain-containing protein [bacterium]|nr:DUF92 domain-containing protein [bacterium]